jgi:hypothetical protein
MDSAAEFRKRAKECLDILQKVAPQSRPILLSIAEAWLTLAQDLEDGIETKDASKRYSGDNVH